MMSQDSPLVSCLLIASNDYARVARSVHCYQLQNWQHKELVIVEHGTEDITPLLEGLPSDEIRHIRYNKMDDVSLASKLNMALEHANGSFAALWGESDWHHPERIPFQVEKLMDGADLCRFEGTLLHLDHPGFVHHPYLHFPSGGYFENVMFRSKPGIRFPESKKEVFRNFVSLWDDEKVKTIDVQYSWLIVRDLEGETGSKSHKRFLKGFRDNTKDLALLTWLKLRGRNTVTHQRFKLSTDARSSFYLYLKESQKLGLIDSLSDG